MQNEILPYLIFNGNCKEAMLFYQSCFGGYLSLKTVGETTPNLKMPVKMMKTIVSATLKTPLFTLIGTDMAPEKGLVKGNNIVLCLKLRSRNEMESIRNQLAFKTEAINTSDTSNVTGDYTINLVDKYNVNWILTAPMP